MRLLIGVALIAISGYAQQMVSLRTSGDASIVTVRIDPINFTTFSRAPYSAKRLTTGVQIRNDGSRIPEDRTVLFYRDAAGRNRTERPVTVRAGSPVMITIMDPLLGCEYVLDPGNKIAHKLIGVQVNTRPLGDFKRIIGDEGQEQSNGSQSSAPSNSARKQVEDLGTQSMQNLEVHGTRTTTTWPAGTFNNNDREVVTTVESWAATSLDVVVLSKVSRPQLIENYSISDVKLGDPDPSLFAPPADYRIVEEKSDFRILIPQTSPSAVKKLSSHGPPPDAISGAPFSGVRTNIVTEALANGTTEQHPEHTVLLTWRDSQGRVRSEWPGQGTAPGAVEIDDPVAGFSYSLDYAGKIAERTPFTPPAPESATAPANAESLGSKTIAGVAANGISVMAIRTGGEAAADGKPFTTVTEVWTAAKEGVMLLEKDSAPNGGGATIELKHFSTLEPDPSLFKVPATYQIVDESGNEIAPATAHPSTASLSDAQGAVQRPAHPTPGEMIFMYPVFSGANRPAVTRAPYSLQNASVQTQPDGSQSTLQPLTSTATYRDSMGRTRSERSRSGFRFTTGGSPQQHVIVMPEIEDPLAGYRYILDPTHQIAHRVVIATRRINPASQNTPVPQPASPPRTVTEDNGATITTENLGTQTIAGVMAMGTRISQTLPPPQGARSTPPLHFVTENWSSVQYGATLLSRTTNQNGTVTTITAKEFSANEPDPALFLVPPGYEIVDETGTFSITISPETGR